jgi:hypothetical protein
MLVLASVSNAIDILMSPRQNPASFPPIVHPALNTIALTTERCLFQDWRVWLAT